MVSSQSIDAKGFRNALGSFTTGVTVVTTVGPGGEDVGLTANSFNSVSLDPPMVLWSLAKTSFSLAAFQSANHFAVHILAEDQEGLSGRFARRGEDKFAGLKLQRGEGNVPLLPDCAARFVCKTSFQYEGGDHIIFVGEVVGFEHWERAPLLFHGGQYGQLIKPTPIEADNEKSDELDQASISELLRIAYEQIVAPIRGELNLRSISVPQYRLLSFVAQHDKPARKNVLAQMEKIGRHPSDKEFEELFGRGLLEENDGKLSLTAAGNHMNMELSSVIKSAESDAQEGLDYTLRQTLVIALEQLIRYTAGKNEQG